MVPVFDFIMLRLTEPEPLKLIRLGRTDGGVTSGGEGGRMKGESSELWEMCDMEEATKFSTFCEINPSSRGASVKIRRHYIRTN